MKTIDLNCDLGEGSPFDNDLLAICSSANVGCGAHAGSPELTLDTAKAARKAGVQVGAHPSYPDRASFGRSLDFPLDDDGQGRLLASLVAQCQVLRGRFNYIKPHGALYNDSGHGGESMPVLAALLARFRVPLMGLPNSQHAIIAKAVGVPLIREGFADRRYGEDGHLMPRSQEGSILTDRKEIAEQSRQLAEQVDSICVHGDNPEAVAVLKHVRRTLEKHGYEVRPWRSK